MTTKPCSKCNQTLPLSSFHRSSRMKDGYRSACKTCRTPEQRRAKTRTVVHEKECRMCGKIKSAGDFRKCRRNSDGLYSHCKTCALTYSRSRNFNNPELKREHSQQHRLRNRDYYTAKKKEWLANNPEKRDAHIQVKKAILRGDLIRPSICQRCKQKARKIEASHDDYSQPLKVEWLCCRCHRLKDNITRNLPKD